MCVDTFVIDQVSCDSITKVIEHVPLGQDISMEAIWVLAIMVVLVFAYAFTAFGGGEA
jgi:uncharacterized membrane protein